MEQSASTRRMLAHHISYGALERTPCQQWPTKAQWESDYSKFRRITMPDSSVIRKNRPCLRSLSDRLRLVRKNHPTLSRWLLQGSWTMSVILVLCLALSYLRLKGDGDSFYSESEWIWDHNVYQPRHPSTGNLSMAVETLELPANNHKRNLLLAQFSGSPALDTMASISSRPNRAYARQWVRDYVRYTGSSGKRLERACFDKVFILSTILAHQVHSDSLWSPASRVQYDAIVILPPDAIITDLDSDLLNLFPFDKLLAVAGYERSTSINDSTLSEVLFFNLRHKYAMEVVELWNSLSGPSVTCGAGNDIQLLLDAVDSVAASKKARKELVSDLTISTRGFVGNRSIKLIPEKVPTSKAIMLVSNAAEVEAELQTTAASVCYRYYPRCDVL
eukprot:scaffold16707_cov182-Amphora_coffeaeformis.AAC.5